MIIIIFWLFLINGKIMKFVNDLMICGKYIVILNSFRYELLLWLFNDVVNIV